MLRPPVFSGEERVYARAGHIPGSLNIPYVDLIEAPTNAFRTTDELGRLLAPALAGAGPLILYCGGGVTAAGSALALTLLGVLIGVFSIIVVMTAIRVQPLRRKKRISASARSVVEIDAE